LFLALEGQEYVWEKLWLEMGVSQEDLEKYFPGPAFLAWHRMGNLDGFAGPQPKGWRHSRYLLQKKVAERMREFGMIAVLTAFAGHIPAALVKVQEAKGAPIKFHRGASKEEGWCGFEATTLLHASDPLFRQIGKRFLELQEEAYGTDSVYSCDTFNEMHVPFTDAPSLRASSKAVIDGMMEADPDAVWLMQGWLFLFSRFWYAERIEAYLSGVANDRMIVLDLFAEKRSMWDETKSFYGKPWIWCQLLNFGGNHGIYGNMTRIAVEPARAARESPSFSGTGMSMESIERNPALFAMLADTVWSKDELDIDEWLQMYVKSRYRFTEGVSGEVVVAAWRLLNQSAYHWNGQLIKSPLEERPRFYDTQAWQPPAYRPDKLIEALDIMLKSVEREQVVPQGPFLQDLVDLARQVLVDVFTDWLLFFETLMALRQMHPGTSEPLVHARTVMLGLFDDLDALLESNVNFMLGPVLHEATRFFGADTEEQFRNILTLWGDGVVLNDYAAKQFSPMVRDYYKRRWKLWLDKTVKQESGVLKDIAAVENTWFKRRAEESDQPKGDSVKLATQMLEKYLGGDASGYQVRMRCIPVAAARIHQTWSHNTALLRQLCSMTPVCGGFSATGLLFEANSKCDSSTAVQIECYMKVPAASEKTIKSAEEKTTELATGAVYSGVALLVLGTLCVVVGAFVYKIAMRLKKAK
jgi:alpha-N-acetylglucosaminidase